MLTKPILSHISTFDASDGLIAKFDVIGGDQIFYNEIEIYDDSNKQKVYGEKKKSFTFEHAIPAEKFSNGKVYYVKLRTFNVNNEASVWSDNLYFKCLQKPIVSIPTVASGKVNNQVVLFQAEFISPQDQLKTYKYLLYDKNKINIAKSSTMFDKLLQYTFNGFLDDELYYIELKVATQENVEVSTGLLPFTAEFITPKLKTSFEANNDYNNASVKIDAKLIQMFWKSKKESYSFEDGSWVNLNNDTIYLDNKVAFGIDSDFTCEIILRDIKEDIPFMLFSGEYGSLELKYFKNRIHAYKKLNGINDNSRCAHYITEESIDISPHDTIFLHIQSIGDGLNMKMENIIYS